MPVKIAVLKETRPHERRVALVPAVADKLVKLGAELHMQTGAGDAVKLPDSAFKNVTFSADPLQLVADADIVASVQPPSLDIVKAMRDGAILISFIYAHKEVDLTRLLRDKKMRWNWCHASRVRRPWMHCPARPRSPVITAR
jgi:NAD(P) transhydrogenase subunit alpha